MKFRTSFVTNSSSSSFICIAKIKMCDELKAYMKEEYGNFGMKLLKNYVEKGSDILQDEYSEVAQALEFIDLDEEIKEDEYYLKARFVTSSTDGDQDGEDAFLYEAIPEKYMEEIYQSEVD